MTARRLTRTPLDPEARRGLRAALRASRARLPEAGRAAAATAIAQRLDGLVGATPRRLAAYWPYEGEPDLRAWMRARHEAGWTLLLPVIAASAAPLVFRVWTPDCAMSADRYGIAIPSEGPVLDPEIVLVPTLGFTEDGHRLGYGGGYYDRTLAALRPRPLAIGVAYESGRLEDFAPDAHDVQLDAVVTERATYRASS